MICRGLGQASSEWAWRWAAVRILRKPEQWQRGLPRPYSLLRCQSWEVVSTWAAGRLMLKNTLPQGSPSNSGGVSYALENQNKWRIRNVLGSRSSDCIVCNLGKIFMCLGTEKAVGREKREQKRGVAGHGGESWAAGQWMQVAGGSLGFYCLCIDNQGPLSWGIAKDVICIHSPLGRWLSNFRTLSEIISYWKSSSIFSPGSAGQAGVQETRPSACILSASCTASQTSLFSTFWCL